MLSKLVARRYAGALLSAAVARSIVDQVERDLALVVATLEKERGLVKFLANPRETPSAKKELLTKAFSGIIPEVLNLLLILVDKKRLDYPASILAEYREEADRIRGIAVAKIRSAQPLSESGLAVVAQRLHALTGKEIKLVVEVDPTVVAGVYIRVGNKIIDATLAKQLEELKQALSLGGHKDQGKRRVRRKTNS